MEFITKGKLYKKLKGKRHVELADLLRIIEEEFKVCMYVKCDEAEIIEITSDHPNIQAIQPSRKLVRSYSNEEGLYFLREKAGEGESDI
ncbi:hypothetical protein KFZ58_13800 [Virgibacillus sp. NKC19-16]|uniref:hypothetical protein n=1 Tax=Virgibacillus salidurans TaxID=2831673 RepID=UPI001F18C7CA|nr:hypothetical protein [Virgibacillus sp. NKC19-16]UJL45470.1 hypothetical protein KFZ58_13800 [Virgibacillus sp. NKC19-16]